MIIPEQEAGIKFWDDFYVKPYRLEFFDGNKGEERYLISRFVLIKVINNEPSIFKAYAYWLVEDLMQKYQIKVRSHLMDIHKAKIPKDAMFHVEGVMKSSLPASFNGTTLDSTIFRVEEDKDKNLIDSTYENVICINNVFMKTTTNDIINHKFVHLAEELTNKLGIYIALKDERKLEGSLISNDTKASAAVIIQAQPDKNGGPSVLDI